MTYTYGVSWALAAVPKYLWETKGRRVCLAPSFRGFSMAVWILCFEFAETHRSVVVDALVEATQIMAAGDIESRGTLRPRNASVTFFLLGFTFWSFNDLITDHHHPSNQTVTETSMCELYSRRFRCAHCTVHTCRPHVNTLFHFNTNACVSVSIFFISFFKWKDTKGQRNAYTWTTDSSSNKVKRLPKIWGKWKQVWEQKKAANKFIKQFFTFL